MIKPIATRNSLFVHVEVQVRLSEHDSVKHDVEHDADEHRAIPVDISGRKSVTRLGVGKMGPWSLTLLG